MIAYYANERAEHIFLQFMHNAVFYVCTYIASISCHIYIYANELELNFSNSTCDFFRLLRRCCCCLCPAYRSTAIPLGVCDIYHRAAISFTILRRTMLTSCASASALVNPARYCGTVVVPVYIYICIYVIYNIYVCVIIVMFRNFPRNPTQSSLF